MCVFSAQQIDRAVAEAKAKWEEEAKARAGASDGDDWHAVAEKLKQVSIVIPTGSFFVCAVTDAWWVLH